MPVEGAWRSSLPCPAELCLSHQSQLCRRAGCVGSCGTVSSPWLQAAQDVRAAPRILAVSPGMTWAPQPGNACSIHTCPWPSPVCPSFLHVLGRALLHLTSQAQSFPGSHGPILNMPQNLGVLGGWHRLAGGRAKALCSLVGTSSRRLPTGGAAM